MKAFTVFRYKSMNQATIPAENDLDAVKRSKMFEDYEQPRIIHADGLSAAIIVATVWKDGKAQEKAVGSLGWQK